MIDNNKLMEHFAMLNLIPTVDIQKIADKINTFSYDDNQNQIHSHKVRDKNYSFLMEQSHYDGIYNNINTIEFLQRYKEDNMIVIDNNL